MKPIEMVWDGKQNAFVAVHESYQLVRVGNFAALVRYRQMAELPIVTINCYV